MFSLRAFLIILLAVVTGGTLGSGLTVFLMRETVLGQKLGFVSSETTARLLTAQQQTFEENQRTPITSDSRLDQILADQASSSRSESEQIKILAAQLEEIVAQQSAMARDFESLRFRVDTHSEGFMPLRTEEIGEESRLRPLGSSADN